MLAPLIGTLLCSAALIATQPTYEVKVERDVVYATADGYWTEAPEGFWQLNPYLFRRQDSRHPLELTLDIYRPADDNPAEARPLLLMMHGGAFLFGNKTNLGHPPESIGLGHSLPASSLPGERASASSGQRGEPHPAIL